MLSTHGACIRLIAATWTLAHLHGCSSRHGESEHTTHVTDVTGALRERAHEDPDAAASDPFGGPEALVAALGDRGYLVQTGLVIAFFVEDCASLPSCYGANATSPYLIALVPPASTEREDAGDGMLSTFRLRRDEAIVLIGQTPPTAAYYSFTPYVFSRFDPATRERATVFASVSDALNLANIATGNDQVFSQQVAIIFAADSKTHDEVRDALVMHEVDGSAVNTVVLPADLLKLGLQDDRDELELLGRVALFDDAEAGRTYLEQPPWRLLRVSPRREHAGFSALEPSARVRRGSGTTEEALKSALDELDTAIRRHHSELPVQEVPIYSAPIVAAALDPMRCLDTLSNCLGEVSDTTYSAGPPRAESGGTPLRLSDHPSDYFIAYGVNHEASGKATYSNVVVQNQAKQAGVVDFTSRQMRGSAQRYLGDHPDADKLFAVKIARACADEPNCIEVPTTFPGVGLEEDLGFVFRAYLEPGHSVSSAPSELLTERVLHVLP